MNWRLRPGQGLEAHTMEGSADMYARAGLETCYLACGSVLGFRQVICGQRGNLALPSAPPRISLPSPIAPAVGMGGPGSSGHNRRSDLGPPVLAAPNCVPISRLLVARVFGPIGQGLPCVFNFRPSAGIGSFRSSLTIKPAAHSRPGAMPQLCYPSFSWAIDLPAAARCGP